MICLSKLSARDSSRKSHNYRGANVFIINIEHNKCWHAHKNNVSITKRYNNIGERVHMSYGIDTTQKISIIFTLKNGLILQCI